MPLLTGTDDVVDQYLEEFLLAVEVFISLLSLFQPNSISIQVGLEKLSFGNTALSVFFNIVLKYPF